MNAIDIFLARLVKEEGERLYPYDDATGERVRAPKGHITWGHGFNLDVCGSVGLFEVMDRYLVGQVALALQRYAWYSVGSESQRSVLLDIAYNEGVEGLLRFPKMLAAWLKGDWASAAVQCQVADERLNASRYAPLRSLITAG